MPLKEISAIPVSQIAQLVGGVLHGNPSNTVRSVAAFEAATTGSLTLLKGKGGLKSQSALSSSLATAFLVETEFDLSSIPENKSIIVVPKAIEALIKCVPLFFEPHPVTAGIHSMAVIDPSAKIGARVTIGAFVVVGAMVEIGDDAVLHPHVVLYPGVRVGARTIIHSGATVREDCTVGADAVIQNGAVIGADGFGYVPDPKIGLRAVPQIGIVTLADRVEIGANSCVDRATLGATSVGLGSKVDNLVQVGHNTTIGSHSILCGGVGIAGSCTIGNQVVLGGQVGVADHLSIADGVRLAAKAGVTSDIKEKGDYGGYPVMPARLWRRSLAAFARLPEITKRGKTEKGS